MSFELLRNFPRTEPQILQPLLSRKEIFPRQNASPWRWIALRTCGEGIYEPLKEISESRFALLKSRKTRKQSEKGYSNGKTSYEKNAA
jgi:hypothetical protein